MTYDSITEGDILILSMMLEKELKKSICQAGKTIRLIVPWTRQELGGAVGRTACAMMAVSDIGSAAALAEKLAARDPERFGEARDALVPKAARAKRRRDETRAHKKNVRTEIGICKALDVEVIDIYHDFYPHETWDDLYLYTDDGLHPNEAGREKIAQTIADYLNSTK